MPTMDAVGTMVGLFLVRLALPLAVTLGLAWWLRRVDARWQAEARAAYIAEQWGRSDAPPLVAQAQAPTAHCWAVRGCSEEQRAACMAYGQPTLPCWLVRLRREGKLPRACLKCELFAVVQSGVALAQPPSGRPKAAQM
jgi:hypothetical protein